MTRQNTVSQYIIVKHNSVIKMSTGPPTQDQQNFVRTSKFFFQFFLRTTVLPRSVAPRFIANLVYRQNSHLSRFPSLKIPCYTAKLSYCHPSQVFRHKSRKTNSNSPVSTAHNYLLTAVYWSVIMECQNWSSDTVIDLIVEGRNRWSVVLIRIIIFTSEMSCTGLQIFVNVDKFLNRHL